MEENLLPVVRYRCPNPGILLAVLSVARCLRLGLPCTIVLPIEGRLWLASVETYLTLWLRVPHRRELVLIESGVHRVDDMTAIIAIIQQVQTLCLSHREQYKWLRTVRLLG